MRLKGQLAEMKGQLQETELRQGDLINTLQSRIEIVEQDI